MELLVFLDPSEKGLGACCYACYVFLDRRIDDLCGPLRQLSIPHLELQAALLAIKLADIIKKNLTLGTSKTVLWSDSKTVLLYILNESR